ncbi:MAG: pantoate--beta-alanine ligase [Bdellovibrionia bacterium]
MYPKPRVITTLPEILKWRRSVEGAKIGFVPTMGALHRGHATLLRELRTRSEISVLSIFVNPIQFAPHEDLDRYPKSFENDLQIASTEGVDVVFAPSAEQLYPKGFTTFVEETHLSLPFCGPFRPGHFRGVTTIVLKLFNLVRPQLALFGLKDAQQFFVLKQMVHDLNLDIEVAGIETVREPDGLALSSRNIYLSSEDRQRAPFLYKCLREIRNTALNSSSDTKSYFETMAQSLEVAKKALSQNGFIVQYLDCLKLPSFDPMDSLLGTGDPQIIAIAAFLGKTRLIDNVIISGPTTLERVHP